MVASFVRGLVNAVYFSRWFYWDKLFSLFFSNPFYNYACFLLLRGMELEQDGTGLGLGHWWVWYKDKASASGVF